MASAAYILYVSKSGRVSLTQVRAAVTRNSGTSETQKVPVKKGGHWAVRVGLLRGVYWAVWLYLCAILLVTICNPIIGKPNPGWGSVEVIVALLFVQYWADGLDFAAKTLLDKDPQQLDDYVAQDIHDKVKKQGEGSSSFFANKEVLDIVIVAAITVCTTFNYIQIPYSPFNIIDHEDLIKSFVTKHWFFTVDSELVRVAFSLSFTSLTVLWFAQVVSEIFARRNPGLFMHRSRPIHSCIKKLSWLHLPSPGEEIAQLLEGPLEYTEKTRLGISKKDLYEVAAYRYGLTWERYRSRLHWETRSQMQTAMKSRDGHLRRSFCSCLFMAHIGILRCPSCSHQP